MRSLAVCIFLLQVLPAAVLAQQSEKPPRILATLSLPHARVLPGVPFDLEVTFKNVSKSAASVGLIARIRVTLPDGTVVSPTQTAWLYSQRWNENESYLELPPGESVTKPVVWRGAAATGWSYDPAFSGPGTYEVVLDLEAASDERTDAVNYVGPVRTSPARLERAVPPGEDEELWKRMLAAGDGRWPDYGFKSTRPGIQLAKEILQLHPGSNYFPYALLLVTDHDSLLFRGEEKFQKFRDAAERFPTSPAHPYLVMAAADAASSVAIAADREGARARAAELYKRAAEWYRAADRTGSLAVQKSARMKASVSERDAREKGNPR